MSWIVRLCRLAMQRASCSPAKTIKFLAFSVGSYVKRGKNDATDAEAICEAVTRPNMRFVPVKSACSRQPTPRSARISTYPGCSDPKTARTEHLLRCAK
jgi:hypothetical protein